MNSPKFLNQVYNYLDDSTNLSPKLNTLATKRKSTNNRTKNYFEAEVKALIPKEKEIPFMSQTLDSFNIKNDFKT